MKRKMTNEITDRLGNEVKVGDIVLYWHRRERFTRPDLGEVVNIPTNRIFEVEYTNSYGEKVSCLRSRSGITRFTKGEALLWKLEGATYND
jgi:hypothetical protein